MTPKRFRHEPVWWADDDRFAQGSTWPVVLTVAAVVLGVLLTQV